MNALISPGFHCVFRKSPTSVSRRSRASTRAKCLNCSMTKQQRSSSIDCRTLRPNSSSTGSSNRSGAQRLLYFEARPTSASPFASAGPKYPSMTSSRTYLCSSDLSLQACGLRSSLGSFSGFSFQESTWGSTMRTIW